MVHCDHCVPVWPVAGRRRGADSSSESCGGSGGGDGDGGGAAASSGSGGGAAASSYECAGDYGVPKMTKDPTKLKELELMELKNGRLAMIGIISFACAEAIPGSVPFYPF